MNHPQNEEELERVIAALELSVGTPLSKARRSAA